MFLNSRDRNQTMHEEKKHDTKTETADFHVNAFKSNINAQIYEDSP